MVLRLPPLVPQPAAQPAAQTPPAGPCLGTCFHAVPFHRTITVLEPESETGPGTAGGQGSHTARRAAARQGCGQARGPGPGGGSGHRGRPCHCPRKEQRGSQEPDRARGKPGPARQVPPLPGPGSNVRRQPGAPLAALRTAYSPRAPRVTPLRRENLAADPRLSGSRLNAGPGLRVGRPARPAGRAKLLWLIKLLYSNCIMQAKGMGRQWRSTR